MAHSFGEGAPEAPGSAGGHSEESPTLRNKTPCVKTDLSPLTLVLGPARTLKHTCRIVKQRQTAALM